MIKVNRADSLKKKQKEMFYRDLKQKDAFVFCGESLAGGVRVRTDSGHFDEDMDHFYSEDGCYDNEKVILVDAEINWCFGEGEWWI